MSGITIQTGADPTVGQGMEGVFQVRRDEEAQGWCVQGDGGRAPERERRARVRAAEVTG